MKLNSLIIINAVLFIALGIAFALYGPLMINVFGMLDVSGASGAEFWFTASFARLLGVFLFGYGFLLWAAHELIASGTIPPDRSQRIVLALLIGNIVGLFVAVTQQWQVWINLAGWITIGLFGLLSIGYTFFLVQGRS